MRRINHLFSIVLLLALLTVTSMTLARDSMSQNSGVSFFPAVSGPVGNDYYQIYVADSGERIGAYTIATGSQHPVTLAEGGSQDILFGGASGVPDTSFNAIRSYSSNSDYTQAPNRLESFAPGFTPRNMTPYHVSTTLIGSTGVRSEWQLPAAIDNLNVVQEINVTGTSFADSAVTISMTVTNNGTTSVLLGFRYLWDISIGADRGPTFQALNPDGAVLTNEQSFPAPGFGAFEIVDNGAGAPNYRVINSVGGAGPFNANVPGSLDFVCRVNAGFQAFVYPVNPALNITSNSANCLNSNGGDSAIVLQYGALLSAAISVPASESVTIEQVLLADDDDNMAPVAVDDTATTPYDTPVDVTVLDNDYDFEGDPISVDDVDTTGTTGAVTVNLDMTVNYDPPPGFSGPDTFSYTIVDDNGGEATAEVTVTVGEPDNEAPIAVDDNATTMINTPVNINVLSNDSDPDGDDAALDVISASDPPNGSVVIEANNTITYTPDGGFTGGDSFTYTISDGEDTDTATVNVQVNAPTNQLPIAGDDSASTAQGVPVVIAVLLNDVDPDGGGMNVSAVGAAANGWAVANPDGTITYTPNFGFSGGDSFEYTLNDSQGGFDTATVTVTVNPAPVCNPGDANYNPNGDLKNGVSGLLSDSTGLVYNASAVCAYQIGMASYLRLDNIIDNQILWNSTEGVVYPGQRVELSVSLPACTAQVDLFYGQVLQSLSGQRYGGRNIAARNTPGGYCTPEGVEAPPPAPPAP